MKNNILLTWRCHFPTKSCSINHEAAKLWLSRNISLHISSLQFSTCDLTFYYENTLHRSKKVYIPRDNGLGLTRPNIRYTHIKKAKACVICLAGKRLTRRDRDEGWRELEILLAFHKNKVARTLLLTTRKCFLYLYYTLFID